jgi:hypothetical protein
VVITGQPGGANDRLVIAVHEPDVGSLHGHEEKLVAVSRPSSAAGEFIIASEASDHQIARLLQRTLCGAVARLRMQSTERLQEIACRRPVDEIRKRP